MLRIVSKASSVESFIQLFRRFCDRESVFIATRNPKAVGTRTRFTINLSTGEPMIAGYGEVTEAYSDHESPYSRPGMRLFFVELDQQSRMVVEQLAQGETTNGRKPPLPGLPVPPAQAQAQDRVISSQTLGMMPTIPHVLPPVAHPSVQPESRAKGSDLVLPANPFGELTNESLEAFVECTLYEDVGPGLESSSPEPGSSRAVTWWPPTGQSNMLPAPPPQSEAGNEPARPTASTPGEGRTARPPIGSPARGSKPMHTAVIVQPKRTSPWRIIAVTVLVSVFLGLGAGYLLWGSNESADTEGTSEAADLPTTAGAIATAAGEDAAPGGDAHDDGSRDPTDGGLPDVALARDDCAVRITSNPDRAAVYAGERRLGATPLQTSLPCGTTELVLKRPRYGDTTELVTLTPQKRARVDVRLRRPVVTLEVTSSPPGASVLLNRKKVGETPLSVELPAHIKAVVVVRKPGYQRARKIITPKPPEDRLHVALPRK